MEQINNNIQTVCSVDQNGYPIQNGYSIDQNGYPIQTACFVDQNGYPIQNGYSIDQNGYPIQTACFVDQNGYSIPTITNVMSEERDTIRYNFFLYILKITSNNFEDNIIIAQNLLTYLINIWKEQLNAYEEATKNLHIKESVTNKQNKLQCLLNFVIDLNNFKNPVDTTEIKSLFKLNNAITANQLKQLRYFIAKLASQIVQSYEMFIGTYDHCSRNKFNTLEKRTTYLYNYIQKLKKNIEDGIKDTNVNFKGNQIEKNVCSFFISSSYKLCMQIYK
jgi:hypothetical protein